MRKDDKQKHVKPAGIAIVSTDQLNVPGFSPHKFVGESE